MFKRRDKPLLNRWSSFFPLGRNPFQPLSRRRFLRAPTLLAPASDTSSDVDVLHAEPHLHGMHLQLGDGAGAGPIQQLAGVVYGLSSAAHILAEPLAYCAYLPKGTPSANTGVAIDAAANMPRSSRRWDQIVSSGFHRAYFKLVDKIHNIKSIPQQTRLLATEGDVGDLVYDNILASVVSVLNAALSPNLRERLEIAVQHQPTVQLSDIPVLQLNGTYAFVNLTMQPDHAIVVTHKYKPGQAIKQPHYEFLVLVEDKRAGFVRPHEWETQQQGRWTEATDVTAHINQMIAYGIFGNSPYFVLTDYRQAVAVVVEPDHIPNSPNGVKVAAYPYLRGRKHQRAQSTRNPIDDGLRHTACVLGIKAMHDLGILDYELAPALAQNPQDPCISELLRKHKRLADEADEAASLHMARSTTARTAAMQQHN